MSGDVPSGQARALLEARLGRPAQDGLEAAVVLEAWSGVRAEAALTLGPSVISHERVEWRRGSGGAPQRRSPDRTSVLAEGIALLMAVVAVATWASPVSRDVGPAAWDGAIRLALPITLALQWAARSRYLSRDDWLGCLRRERLISLLVLAGVEATLFSLGRAGVVAALLVPIWTGGTVLVRRGWGVWYGLLLLAASIALTEGTSALPVLAPVALLTLLAVALALSPSESDSGSPGRLTLAAAGLLVGGGLGVLLVADHTVGWGVRGSFPALALIPSTVGSFWAGYYLWRLHVLLPRALQGLPITPADRVALKGSMMAVLAGSILRLVGATGLLSVAVVLAAPWTSGSSAISLFAAFGCVALATLVVSLLLGLGRAGWALLAVGAAVAAEVALDLSRAAALPGSGLMVGGTIAFLLALPPLVALFLKPARVLATTVWIS